MRILITRFPFESARGGAESQTVTLARGLRARGHDVHFLGSCPVLLEWLANEGVPVHRLSIGKPPVTIWLAISFFWRRFTMSRTLKKAFRELCLQGNFDGVLMLSLSEKILLTNTVIGAGAKVLWVEHDRVGRWLSQSPFLGTLRYLSSFVTTIPVSELSERMYVALGWPQESVHAIPNGIEFAKFNGTTVMDKPACEMHVGCVARLSPDKGVDVLLEAVADMPHVALTIVGQGREDTFIQTWIETITLKEGISPPRIRLLPFATDLGAFYRSMDVLVLPSREHDPFGLVAAEAMSQGVAVIISDKCGIAQQLHTGVDALVVRGGDTGTLKEALEQMLKNPDMRKALGEEGRRSALRQFKADGMVSEYENLLKGNR